ncbi:MAG: PQQ-like beta-propeller repeat protein [Bacteroidia bacterium]|nr:PQQ-like beta-propeller repeat protein [Bacteroidia bacterium]
MKSVSPIENNRVEKLIGKLSQNPNDEELKQQIRSVDLMTRKAFFTSEWQLDIGSYFLLVAVILLIASVLIYNSLKFEVTKPEAPTTRIDFWMKRSNERIWILSLTMIIVAFVVVLLFLSKNSYTDFNTEKDGLSANEYSNTNDVKDQNIQIQEILKKADNSLVNSIESITDVYPADADEKDFPDDNSILSNYPSFRGPFGLGVSNQQKLPTEWDGVSGKNIVWKTAVPLPGYNSPVVWGNYIFLSGATAQKREVYCFNRKNGKLIWSRPVENIKGSPAAAPKVTDAGYSASTLTTDGKRVFAIFANGDLICFDFEGKQLWAKNLGVPDNHYGHASSLNFFHNLLIVQYDQNKTRNLLALSTHTGNVRWNTTRPGHISWASPIIVKNGNQYEIIVNNEPYVASYDPETGNELWKVDCLSGEIGPSPAYADGVVFAVNTYAKLTAVKAGNPPKIIWENEDFLSDVSSPVAWKDYLIVTTSAGEVACYNTKDGTLFWSNEFDIGFYASPIIANGKIYMMNRNGVMHIMKTDKKFSLVGVPKIGEKSDCTPAFANGQIYIRGQKNLYCVGNK